MRRDHRPLFVKRAAAALSQFYAERYVVPQLEAIGDSASFINPRYFHVNGPRVRIGARLHCMATRDRPIHLTVHPDQEQRSRLDIGSYCILLPGVRVTAATAITIGDNCMLASNSSLSDADWHDLYDRTAAPGVTRPIELADNVWIGDSAIVCKGVKIGENSIVGAGSVVTRDVPANTIVAGNPARPVRELDARIGFKRREALFREPESYDAYLRRYDAFMLKDNSFAKWVRSLVLPSRDQ